jgi:hypothetical protein
MPPLKLLLKSLFVLLSFALSESALGMDCKIAGYEFIEEATKAGWPIEPVKTAGEGACTFLSPVVLVAAAENAESVTCNVRFFPEQSLKNSWRISKVSFSGAQWRFVEPVPDFPSASATLIVQVSVKKGESKSLAISDVTFVKDSGDCRNWKNVIGGTHE